MTIGQKIARLRVGRELSQEQLAEVLSVSRQSVSKWETDSATPGIDKITLICKFFGITSDDLLSEKTDLGVKTEVDSEGHKYFGTDGFRGESNVYLTSMHAYKVGRFLGWYYSTDYNSHSKILHRPRIVIGKDTRRSSYMLEYSLVAGITASGADAYLLHVTTTPGVSYITRQEGFDCGIMITASHNPYYDNGIKIMNSSGEKLDDRTVSLIECYLDGNLSALGVLGDDLPLAERSKIGCIHDYVSGRNRYMGYLISIATNSYKKLRIGLDCANGASWMIANAVFSALGAKTYVIGNEPNGLNINDECGSTHIEKLQRLVRENNLDVGFAFDGDADRCIAVDENGRVVDGDSIIYVLGKRLKEKGILNENTVVTTVMSNSGFISSLRRCGIDCVTTSVGDRFVYECMQNMGYSLGGEQSGHIIMKKYATTGDGILTAIMLAEEICDTKQSLSMLVAPVEIYPQYLKNVRVTDKNAVVNDKFVVKVIKEVESMIGSDGRVLIRKSGTEPVVRVMIESKSKANNEKYADMIVTAIYERGYGIK